jgi:hypothetical protein
MGADVVSTITSNTLLSLDFLIQCKYCKRVSIQNINYHNNNYIQGESKKTDTFDIQMNNKGVSFFWLTLYRVYKKKGDL